MKDIPEILGVEFSGHVVGVGADVTEWKIDDEVLGLVIGVCGSCLVSAP